MVQVSLQFDPNDVADFRRQIDRLINELGKSPEDAVRMGTVALLKALKSSTRKSAKTRKVRQDMVAKINLRSGRRSGVRVRNSYVVERWRGGQLQKVPISAGSLAEAKQHPAAQIRYAGLAKASWGWAAKRLFGGGAGNDSVRNPRRAFLATSKTGSGGDFTVTIENTLDYVSQSFGGGRGPAVSTAMRRASNMMRGRIEQRLKGAMK